MTGSQFQPTQRVVYRASVEAMAAAMKGGTFNWSGMDDPIIVDAKNTLVQGHHRVIAARLAGVRIPESAIHRMQGEPGRARPVVDGDGQARRASPSATLARSSSARPRHAGWTALSWAGADVRARPGTLTATEPPPVSAAR